jgi:hypothetical protein
VADIAAIPAQGPVAIETTALLGRVGQLVVAIGQFQRAQVQLEAFSYRNVTGGLGAAHARQRALRGRIVVHRQQLVGRERGLQAMRHQQVEPVVAGQPGRIDHDVAHRLAQCCSLAVCASMPRRWRYSSW